MTDASRETRTPSSVSPRAHDEPTSARPVENKDRRCLFEPRLVAFVCTWCTYAGADLAGTTRLPYASNVRTVRVPCTGRVSAEMLLKAFEQGADGVLVSGCHPEDCHFASGNLTARRRWIVLRRLVEFVGIDPRRVQFAWVSASEGRKWADLVNDVVADLRHAGPFSEYHRLNRMPVSL